MPETASKSPPVSADNDETLDPRGDWTSLRSLGHRMVDDMLDHLASLPEQPVWQPLPATVKADLGADPLPRQPCDPAQVYAQFQTDVLPYPSGNLHPRFWGWVQGNGTPLSMLADMLASGMNPHLAGFDQSAAVIEQTVTGWLKQMMNFPADASGLLVSGGSMAGLLGLNVARHAMLTGRGFAVRERGLQDPGCPRAVAYGSTEVHGWARKSMELLGLGRQALRLVPVDAQYRMNVEELRARVQNDRQEGLFPFCVIATAGTVNTGATDDLEAIADFCLEENLWLHVDGAFGALAQLSPDHSHLVRGLERADSLSFDLHKWMYLSFECACLLVRRPGAQREAFAASASYLNAEGRGVAAGPMVFADLGVELTRGFKALKVWMNLKAYGVEKFGRLIAQNIAQVQHLVGCIERSPSLKLMAPAPMNIACFRFEAPGLEEEALNRLNVELLLRLQESGVVVLSGTRLNSRFVLRCANVNHRSRLADFDLLIEHAEQIGFGILQEMSTVQASAGA